ncbi:WUSCHEL-related homeobox 7-like [Phragmites australis]|uniref:WUSCHEL-related homeobox 7-like n=1 Tax=Phragmites australis TaxID=29695 RepID=UPI002D77ECE0|nr:WUSCHEL-related homeobox 7-like [Phragmites australis]
MAAFNNRHWPSMFRSKHAGQPWQTQPNMSSSPPSLLSGGSTTTTGCSLKHSSSGGENRSPDPKPRWNPRPEQIRILEAIFNSGMVNPPRDEIPRIRMRLQEYGQVGDANVFYWFQNRKSRSKNKMRTACAGRAAAARACAPAREAAAPVTPPAPQIHTRQQVELLASPVQAPTSSSSSSSDRSSGSSKPAVKPGAQAMCAPATAAMDLLGPPAAACPQMYYQGHPVAPASAPAPKVQELVAAEEPIFLPFPQGYCLSAAELAAILGAQYMHVPAQQQTPPLPAGTFLGHCNEVTEPTITGHRSCAWGAGLGQYWPGGADHHQLGRNTATSNTVAREQVVHEDALKLGLLQYGFGVSMDVDASSAADTMPLVASPDATVTVASVAASTAGLAGFAASTVANGVIANYDQLQGLADGAVGVTGAPAAAVPTGAEATDARGFAVLWIMDSTGKSVVHNDVAATNLDVRTQFGEAAILFRYIGDRPEHVPVDASGCTVEPLQNGAVYYVLV